MEQNPDERVNAVFAVAVFFMEAVWALCYKTAQKDIVASEHCHDKTNFSGSRVTKEVLQEL